MASRREATDRLFWTPAALAPPATPRRARSGAAPGNRHGKDPGGCEGQPATALVVKAPEQPFDGLELAVIDIGRRDAGAHAGGKMRFVQWLQSVFGPVSSRPLASPRLEALRLLVIALRQQRRSPQKEIDDAMSAGVSRSQIDRLLEMQSP